jgi:hypothetical protein
MVLGPRTTTYQKALDLGTETRLGGTALVKPAMLTLVSLTRSLCSPQHAFEDLWRTGWRFPTL